MKVIFRETAYRDLDEIHAWIAAERPAVADQVIDRIIQSTELLDHFPYIGHAGKTPGTQEWVVAGLPYILVFTVDREADELAVIAVFHGARNR
ncbi:MAG TPA: type II toxin-antitoxin system RelE/ParE family toxin [Stellaceae bacterium]|nr:type II toxin-antitoxin system RelE/ParE family toxin [Stellaceae bacterium]